MFSATQVPVQIIRACGHPETEQLRYRGMRDKTEQLRVARSCFCSHCKVLVKSWFESTQDLAPYPVQLQSLVGSEKQVKWAQSIRAIQLKKLLPIMTTAAEHGDKLGASVWRALFMLATQRQATFWIENRERGFSHYFVESEAALFAAPNTYGVVFQERSLFGLLKKRAPYVIEEVKRLCPVSLEQSHA
ncbi:hypothetical protein [Stutzerimonas stutzeri]|uniref:hypothetical protein n=1 Tax=Stutzerimonas stutzeri TaxID=316 RepID=UPI0015E46816|nr:hypothetical protein [Stutzerimonas stutzeri]MBA1280273.1 hypothetical protein [Stutzerimonas stutzeri]